jgi:hypothetical protein
VSVDTTYTERWRQLKEARELSRGTATEAWRLDPVAVRGLEDRFVELRMTQPRAVASTSS